MQAQFAALAHGGSPSLAELGYVHAGVDDGWQACNSYYVQPSNSSAFHDADGVAIVNKTKFPNGVAPLATYGASLGLKVGWYINNCICHERGGHIHNQTWRNLSYYGDIQQLVEGGFVGVKVDSCGLHNDMTEYVELLNKTGKTFLIERSCQGSDTPTNMSYCPYNFYRSSGDIRASWSSVMRNLHTVPKYENFSRPGCWAYPDMLQVGRLTGPLAVAESRTHFGAWCVVSSPLILGFDLTNATTTAAVWPYIANPEAIEVNQAWAGDPGRLIGNVVADTSLEVWAKRLNSSATAVFVINTSGITATAKSSVLLTTVDKNLGKACSNGSGCPVRDIWNRKTTPDKAVTSVSIPALEPHDSAFMLVRVKGQDNVV